MSLLSRLSVLLHTLCVLAAVKKTARPYDEYCTGRYLNGKQLSLFLLSEQQELRSCRFYTDKDSAKGENVLPTSVPVISRAALLTQTSIGRFLPVGCLAQPPAFRPSRMAMSRMRTHTISARTGQSSPSQST